MPQRESDQPKEVNLTEEQAQQLRERLLAGGVLDNEQRELLAGLLSFNVWLQRQLSRANFGIRQLKALFGFNSEKKKR